MVLMVPSVRLPTLLVVCHTLYIPEVSPLPLRLTFPCSTTGVIPFHGISSYGKLIGDSERARERESVCVCVGRGEREHSFSQQHSVFLQWLRLGTCLLDQTISMLCLNNSTSGVWEAEYNVMYMYIHALYMYMSRLRRWCCVALLCIE